MISSKKTEEFMIKMKKCRLDYDDPFEQEPIEVNDDSLTSERPIINSVRYYE